MTQNTGDGTVKHTVTKEMPCRYCGEPITVSVRKRVAPKHLECAIRTSHEEITQLSARSGPFYEAWKVAHARNPGGRPRGGGVSRETKPT
jgi:hypothetical protein